MLTVCIPAWASQRGENLFLGKRDLSTISLVEIAINLLNERWHHFSAALREVGEGIARLGIALFRSSWLRWPDLLINHSDKNTTAPATAVEYNPSTYRRW